MNPVNLLSLTPDRFQEICREHDLPPYRARQVFHWVARRYITDYEEMTNLSRDLRRRFMRLFPIHLPETMDVRSASDGTQKFRLRLDDGEIIESVRMPREGRTTLCLSSQTGCPLACTFCLTGKHTGRNMSVEEIIGQFLVTVRGLEAKRVNIVFMGMGEPLLNLDNVLTALDFLTLSISLRRITLSTAGILDGIRALGERAPKHPLLALSLNAPDDPLRRSLMPGAHRYSMKELFSVLDAYPRHHGQRVTLEYVLLAGVNDSLNHARALAGLMKGRRRLYKINLIPFNPVSGLPYREPEEGAVGTFLAHLAAAHLTVTVRRSAGREIRAACGQLAAEE